jgi:hypothetical protein
MIHETEREILTNAATTTDHRVSDFLQTARFPIPVRHPEASKVRNQYAPNSSGENSTTNQTPLETHISPIPSLHQHQHQKQRAAGTVSPSPTTAKQLRQQFGSETTIPDLTLDQSKSFHRLLREAKREAEQRVAQQRLQDAAIREREILREQERLQRASPERQRAMMEENENNNTVAGEARSAADDISTLLAPNHNKKQEQSQQEAEVFHSEVMSWYKRGFGRSYMNSPSPNSKNRKKSPPAFAKRGY